MTLKTLPIKAIYDKIYNMLTIWNNNLEDSQKYKGFFYQEVDELKEGNLYFDLTSLNKNSYGYYDVTGVFYKDFNAKTLNKDPDLNIFDVLNDIIDKISYLETEDVYSIDAYSETSPHSRVLTLNFKGVINPYELTLEKLRTVGYNIEPQEEF